MKKNFLNQSILLKRIIIACVGFITHRTFRSKNFKIIGSQNLNNLPDNNVLFVHAAGNSGEDVDVAPNFPDDNVNFVEVGNTYIRVGALAPK